MLLEKKSQVRIRDKRLNDAYKDYTWRCDVELARLDAMAPLSISLSAYLEQYKEELAHSDPDQRRFAIETLEGKHIGNCMYYDFNENRGEAEIGILIGERDYWDKGYGKSALEQLLEMLFANENIQRVHLKTLAGNVRAQRCFLRCGFIPCGRLVVNGNHFVMMEIRRHHWLGKEQTANSR